MSVSWLTDTQFTEQQIAAAQAEASTALDASEGSVLLAVAQSETSAALWIQGLILQVLAVTRAMTSQGADLDSWVGDFGVTRLPATFAAGAATFSRFTATQRAVVPVGTLVAVGVGGLQYAVTIDATNPGYSATLNGYVCAAGVSSVTVPIQAVLAGSAGNALAGTLNAIIKPINFIDTVTNALNLAGGFDAESDPALRIRFVLYIQSLSKATKYAVGYAVTSLRQGLVYLLVENKNIDGSANPGFFFVVVDDGTGSPPSYLINAAGTAIEAIRACSVTFAVFAPTIVTANISMVTTSAAGANHSADVAAVTAALTAAINALPLGAGLAWSQIIQIARNASPTITNVVNVLLNGGTSDLSITQVQVVKVGTLGIS